MPLTVNLRHLEDHNVILQGELTVAELEVDDRDEMVRVGGPLLYDLEVQKMEEGLLVRGRLQLPLHCECVRCLKPLKRTVGIEEWACHLALEGEEAVLVVNDCVDLTPWVRDDILLEFPQHPLCKPDCRGLKQASAGKAGTSGKNKVAASAWSQLDKLKL